MWLTPCSMVAVVANGRSPSPPVLLLKRFLKSPPRAPRRRRRAAAVTAAGSILGALFAMIMRGVSNLVRTAHRLEARWILPHKNPNKQRLQLAGAVTKCVSDMPCSLIDRIPPPTQSIPELTPASLIASVGSLIYGPFALW